MISDTQQKITEAIAYAMAQHAGQVNEETGQLYILHPMETLQILTDMQADVDVQVAGVLLHTVEFAEPAKQTMLLEELANRFGQTVADMVALQTRDFSQIWAIQNTGMIQKIAGASESDKQLFFADQLSALRGIARHHRLAGDDMWNRWLKTSKEKYAWFTNGVLDLCKQFGEEDYTAEFYMEMANLYKDLFVQYTIDPTFTMLYQANAFGQAHCLTKGTASWVPVNYRFRQEDIPLSRKEAESLEEKWYDIILATVEEDCVAEFAMEVNGLSVVLAEGIVSCTDEASGQTVSFYEEESYDLLLRLREQFGVTMPMTEIFTDMLYSFKNPLTDFVQLCGQLGLHPTF